MVQKRKMYLMEGVDSTKEYKKLQTQETNRITNKSYENPC